MSAQSLRIVARFQRKADLDPPLGKPGGPCQVIDRIDDRITSPGLRSELETEVGKGQTISNPDAAKVYPLEHEPGAGRIKHLLLTSHVQYRMDLRSVTVDDVRSAIGNWSKALDKLRSMKHPRYELMIRELNSGKVEWRDPKSDLLTVFEVQGDKAAIVTAYWPGKRDPRPVPPEACHR